MPAARAHPTAGRRRAGAGRALVAASIATLLAGLAPAGPAAAASHHHRPAPPAAEPFSLAPAMLEPVAFADLDGWAGDDHASAFATFLKSCAAIRSRGDPGAAAAGGPRPVFLALRPICARAEALHRPVGEARARAFFEHEFVALRIAPLDSELGFLTGYYEPEVAGAREPSADYAVPLYRRPPDLIAEPPPKGSPPANRGQAFRLENGEKVPYYDRGAIMDGALAGKGLEIAWIKDPADAFFAHIQGSVRVKLPDGGVLRLNYDGHNGQPYTPVGRVLVEQGILPREKVSMDAIRAYISADAEKGRELMRQNRSYVFFRRVDGLKPGDGAVGAQGLPLTAGRSIAVDRGLHVYGTPFYIEADLPTGANAVSEHFRRLMIAQDTGSAIIGPARADLFFGAGAAAGSVAGRIRQPGRFTLLLPRALDPARRHAPRPVARPADAPKAVPVAADAPAEIAPQAPAADTPPAPVPARVPTPTPTPAPAP
ncbi:murein transglycosylase A [Ancylobacter terrae]|uniref:murein transglycosylase A n=1 Tax=Ancylobacter sp. sgz301288 TaxID=3342077 RepID=UPI00385C8FCA